MGKGDGPTRHQRETRGMTPDPVGKWIIQQLSPRGIPMHMIDISRDENGRLHGVFYSEHAPQEVQDLSFDGQYLQYKVYLGSNGDELFGWKFEYHMGDSLLSVQDDSLARVPLKGIDFDIDPSIDQSDKYTHFSVSKRGPAVFGYKIWDGYELLDHAEEIKRYL